MKWQFYSFLQWRIRPCSMKVMAVLRFWAMRRLSMMLGSRLLQESLMGSTGHIQINWDKLTTNWLIKQDLPAEWRCCDFLCQRQILFGRDESNTVTRGKNIFCECNHTASVKTFKLNNKIIKIHIMVKAKYPIQFSLTNQQWFTIILFLIVTCINK